MVEQRFCNPWMAVRFCQGAPKRSIMKLYEATVREPGPGTEERRVRIGAESAEEARRKLQELYGPRSVPYLPRLIAS